MLLVGSNLQRDDADTRQANPLNRATLRATDDVPELLTAFGTYVQEQWQAVRRLNLMGGLRYSHVHYSIDDLPRTRGTFVDSYSASQVNPKGGIAFAPLSGVEVYANASTGMRSPTPRTEVRSETYPRMTFRAVYEPRNRYHVFVGGFAYPGSRVGESAFLFGTTVGVGPNPRVSVDAALTYRF